MEYVESMGAVWRLSNRNFKKLERAVKSGEPFNLDDFGTMITGCLHNLSAMEELAQLGED